METKYLNTDLDLKSNENLQALVDDLGNKTFVLHHGIIYDSNHAAFELSRDIGLTPEEAVNGFCELIENLSPQAKKIWDGCFKRILDVGIEAGDMPRPFMLEISSPTLNRISALGISLMVSVYPKSD